MARRRWTTWVTVAAALATGAIYFGTGAATATGTRATGGSNQEFADRLPGRPVASMAEAKQIAAAQWSDAGRAGSRPGQTLILVLKPGRAAAVDLPPRGGSPGDLFFFEDPLFESSGNRRLGLISGVCQLSIRTLRCEATHLVAGRGKIEIAGALFPRGRGGFTFPVTGGTGAFEAVGGELTVFNLPGGNQVLIFHLVR